MYGNFQDDQCILKYGQKPDSFAAHYEQQFNYTTPCTGLCNYMTFKIVNNTELNSDTNPLKNPTETYLWRNF